MTKTLIVEEPNQPEQEHSWDENTKRRFQFTDDELEDLENEEVVWRGDIAYTIYQTEEEK